MIFFEIGVEVVEGRIECVTRSNIAVYPAIRVTSKSPPKVRKHLLAKRSPTPANALASPNDTKSVLIIFFGLLPTLANAGERVGKV
jgi:hypothetical protein